MLRRALITSLLLMLASTAMAELRSLDNAELAAVSGSGIAVALQDFMWEMKPTSYAEQIGSAPANSAFTRGDLRWYGANVTGAGDGSSALDGSNWQDGACDGDSLDCPRGGVIHDFAPFDNPYILRTWAPAGVAYDGTCINGGAGTQCSGGDDVKSVYQYLAPTQQPDYTYSFWGEVQANYTGSDITDLGAVASDNANNGGSLSTSSTTGTLKSQTIIRGNAAGSEFMLFQSTDPTNTLGMIYKSYLQGDFHFSVNQTSAGATDVIGEVPVFSANSGLYFKNVHAFIPFGQAFYQALILGPCTTALDAACTTAGGMYLAMPKIHDVEAVYKTFYGLASGDTQGYDTARMALPEYTSNNGTTDGVFYGSASASYQASHGYSYWGDWYPTSRSNRGVVAPGSVDSGSQINGCINLADCEYYGGTPNGHSDTNDGIYFTACATCANLNANAFRPTVIDVRGLQGNCTSGNNCMEQVQEYRSDGMPGAGPLVGAPDGSNGSYGTNNGNHHTLSYRTVNLGDSRIAGLLIQNFQMINCSAGPSVCN